MSSPLHRDGLKAKITELLWNGSVSGSDVSLNVSDMDSEIYNDNDPDLIQYVRKFKAKIEGRYIRSETNKNYVFPRNNGSFVSQDSEKSLESLQNVRFYQIASQNNQKSYEDHEMLAEVIHLASKMHIIQLRHLLR